MTAHPVAMYGLTLQGSPKLVDSINSHMKQEMDPWAINNPSNIPLVVARQPGLTGSTRIIAFCSPSGPMM